MDELQNQNNHELIHCRYDNSSNKNRLMEYLSLDNRTEDPLREPEVTMNLNEVSAHLPLHPLEEPEEALFYYEADISLQDVNTESEELTISNDEVDEGIFEDEPASNLVLPDDNNRYNSQPP